MAAAAFGEGRLPRWSRGCSLLRHSSPGYEGREPLLKGRRFFIADRPAQAP